MQVAKCLPIASALLLLFQGGVAFAREYHVDASAKVGGNGSLEQPFATIQQAADVMKPGDVCLVHQGVYRETVRPTNSGTADRPLIFRAIPGEKAVLSGCRPVTAWTHEEGQIYSAAAPMRLGHENQVFASGNMLLEARWPNAGQPVPTGLLEFDVATMDEGTTPTKIAEDSLPNVDLAGAHVWASTHKRWYCWTGSVRGRTQGAIEIEDNSDSKGNHVCKPGGDLLYYNNTVSDAKWSYRSTWAAAQAKDLYGCQLINNVGTSGMATSGKDLLTSHNTWHFEGLLDKRFPKSGTDPIDSGRVVPTITDGFTGSAPDRGAYELGVAPWRAGHDFDNPPEAIDTTFTEPPARNRIVNAAFYRGELRSWQPFGKHVRVVRDSHSQWVTDAKSMMGGHSVELGSGRCGLRQTVHGLEPGATYELMAMFRVPDGAAARLRVRKSGGPEMTSKEITSGAPHWNRCTLRLTLGEKQTSAEVVLEKTSGGAEPIHFDDPGLQLVE